MKWLMLLLATAFAQTMTGRPPSECINPPRALSGSWRGTTTGSNLGFGGSCNGASYNSAGGENLVVVSLPMNAPLGGTLTLDTCNGTTWDTQLIVSTPLPQGIRCPTNSSMFTCAFSNDDAQRCGSGMQSRVSFPGTPGASYAVIVAGYGMSSGFYTLTWNYDTGSSSAISRSNTPSMRPSSSGSFTSQPSWSSTMSPSPAPSWSSSITASPSASPTMSPSGSPSSTISSTGSPSPTMTSSASWTSTQSPSISFSSSPTMTASASASPDPSFSNSFTMRSSESVTPSVDESPSMSESYSETSSASQSWSQTPSGSPSKSPAVVVGGSRVSTDVNALGYGSMGIVLGVFLTSIIGGVLYNTNKRNKIRRSVHLSPQIIFSHTPMPESSTELKNASFRIQQKRVEFDPVPAA